ncbi:MAG: ABC transporter substrate-binding protein [Nitrospirae bacterium]|uniref:ABC transporter substrate-binding protein n=1 Tax=Candidatus Magnetobacterium casense TaxID=1455061 RepID=UPI00058DD56B|nr:ABC transporter substrate-binding protein [Candidatus Magnetobacterium casensis]MBF0337746.1 ABC transporter substrate-binding protein [Nitrospirota bacterium]
MRLSAHKDNVMAAVVVLLTVVACSLGVAYTSAEPPADPRYSKYEFGNGKNVINVGIQPMYLPTNIITEVMRCDAVLYDMLKDLGMEIRFFPFSKGRDVNYFLLRGDLQVGVGGDMPAIVATSTDKVVVASLMQYGFTSVVTKKHMRIKDLSGARIGYAFGSNAHYTLLSAMSIGGNIPKNVRLVKMEVTDMVAALRAHKIDAFAAWEPTVTEALVTLPGSDVIYSKVSSGFLYFGKDFYASHPDAAEAIVASELRALRWLKRSEQNLLTAARWALDRQKSFSGKLSPLTPEQIAAIALKDLPGMNTDPRLPMGNFAQHGMMSEEFDFLKSIGFIPSEVSMDVVYKNFQPDIIRRIVNNPLKYKLNEYRYDR